VLPEKRITFLDAARVWSPGVLTTVHDDDGAADGASSDGESPDGGVSVVESPCESPVIDGPSTILPPSSDSSVRRRLALKGLRGHQGRNRTRKSSRN
jgi:hypothetical protein